MARPFNAVGSFVVDHTATITGGVAVRQQTHGLSATSSWKGAQDSFAWIELAFGNRSFFISIVILSRVSVRSTPPQNKKFILVTHFFTLASMRVPIGWIPAIFHSMVCQKLFGLSLS